MTNRRMISGKILCSDAFLALPSRSQLLYIHMVLLADDDGFLNNRRQAISTTGSSKRNMKDLTEGGFVLLLEDDVVVIRHWRSFNNLRGAYGRMPSFPEAAARVYVNPGGVYDLQPAAPDCPTLMELKLEQIARQEEKPSAPRGEQNRTEQKRTEKNRTEQNRTPQMQTAWEALWSAYPEGKKGNKLEAEKAYFDVIFGEIPASKAMDNLTKWKRSNSWRKDEGRYVPTLCNYLRRGVWATSPPAGDGVSPSGTLGRAELEAIRNVLREGVGR